MQREEAANGNSIGIAEARKRMKSLIEPLLRAKTQRARKRALKLLGWTTDVAILAPNELQQVQVEKGVVQQKQSAMAVAQTHSKKQKMPSNKKKSTDQDACIPKDPSESTTTFEKGGPNAAATSSDRKGVYEGELPVFPTAGARSVMAPRRFT